jgi:hypothetical protein
MFRLRSGNGRFSRLFPGGISFSCSFQHSLELEGRKIPAPIAFLLIEKKIEKFVFLL